MLDAAQAMLKAKENIAEIAVNQVAREPVTNLINHLMNASSLLTSIRSEGNSETCYKCQKRTKGSGVYIVESNQKIGVVALMKSLNDPDINRAVKFGLHFLKGMGKELDEK